ncbi:MAG TPA: hypothetical protein VFW73_02195 [Lacipirellulaceae bacterium]|nr:hypothetical protein [Lacipirellulaceae bacterium]
MFSAPSRVLNAAALSASLLALLFATAGSAQTIDLSLNVFYTTPSNMNSGGTWELVAKSSDFGIAALDALVTNINSSQNEGPRGTVNGTDPAGFGAFADSIFAGNPPQPTYHDLSIGQEPLFSPLPSGHEESVFYGVGTLTNGSPDYPGKPAGSNSIGPTFTSLSNVADVPWATGDAFGDSAWNTAARFASGTFATNVTPAFVDGSSGQVFTSLGSSSNFGNIAIASTFTTIVRTNFAGSGSADYNHNGVVDAADYIIWRKTLGSAAVPSGSGADGNGSGTIDQGDYDLWHMQFGSTAGAGAGANLSTSAVPEPACCMLLAIGAMLAGAKRRARRGEMVNS